MLKSERQEKILAGLQRYKMVSVAELKQLFDVSEITIRRDLDDLEQEGYLHRVHGGARIVARSHPEPPVLLRQKEQIEEKEAISAAALEFIHDGDVIALESGSTTIALARKIAEKEWQNLQIITNNFEIQKVLRNASHIQLIFIGGFVDQQEMCTYGELAETALKCLRVRKYFCGCRGIDPEFGRSNNIQTGFEIGTVRSFAEISDQIILLADHTKFGLTFALQMLPSDQIDVIITSDRTPAEILTPFEARGIRIRVAGVEPTLAK